MNEIMKIMKLINAILINELIVVFKQLSCDPYTLPQT